MLLMSCYWWREAGPVGAENVVTKVVVYRRWLWWRCVVAGMALKATLALTMIVVVALLVRLIWERPMSVYP